MAYNSPCILDKQILMIILLCHWENIDNLKTSLWKLTSTPLNIF